MKEPSALRFSRLPAVIGWAAFILLFVLFQGIAYRIYRLEQANEAQLVHNEAMNVKDQLEGVLYHSVTVTEMLAYLLENDLMDKHFDQVCHDLLAQSRYIDALQLVEGNVITRTYPLIGHERAIGYDMMSDPDHRREALNAIQRRELYFEGPFELLQGGRAIVGRNPIFKENKYWGFAVAIIRQETLTRALGLDTTSRQFAYQVTKISANGAEGAQFFKTREDFSTGVIGRAMVPVGNWAVYVKSKTNQPLRSTIWIGGLGLILAVTLGLFSWHLSRQPGKLEQLVWQRTRDWQESETRYRQLFEQSPTPLFIWDFETLRIMDCNEQALRTYGYTREEFLSLTIREIRPPEEIAKIEAATVSEQVYGNIHEKVWRHQAKDGRLMYMKINGHLIDYNGRRSSLVAAYDITDIIETELELHESNERFLLSSKATSDAIWDWNLKTNHVTRAGDGFERSFGYASDAADEDDLFWISRVHPSDVAAVTLSQNQAINDPNESYWEAEYRFRMQNGRYAHVLDKGYIVRDAGGRALRMIGATQNITQRKEYEESLKQLNLVLEQRTKELARSNEELEQFAYVASHDLQEPLRMVTSFLSQLERKYASQLDENARKYIHFAVDGAHRMRGVILDLLEFSRVGKHDGTSETVDVAEVIREVCILQRQLIQDKKAEVKWDFLPQIAAYRAPLLRVFQNLIGNALKYSKPHVPPVVQITCREEPFQWVFAIADNGIGIAPEFYDRIFVIFQRLHAKSDYAGNGMGLAIVKKIVEHLGGHIWVESTEGTGSTFFFTIPKFHKH